MWNGMAAVIPRPATVLHYPEDVQWIKEVNSEQFLLFNMDNGVGLWTIFRILGHMVI